MNVYSIYDAKSQTYQMPFYQQNDATCERLLLQTMSSGDSLLRTNPEDFICFHLGNFDDQTGKMELYDAPKVLFKLHELRAPDPSLPPLDGDGYPLHQVST